MAESSQTCAGPNAELSTRAGRGAERPRRQGRPSRAEGPARKRRGHERGLLERVRVREVVLEGAEIGDDRRALLRAAKLSVREQDTGGNTHAKERALHEVVIVLGEPARLEHAVVALLQLAEPPPEPAHGRGARAGDGVEGRAGVEDTAGAIEHECAEHAGSRSNRRGRGRAVEREREVEHGGEESEMSRALSIEAKCAMPYVSGCRDGYLEKVLSGLGPSVERERIALPRGQMH
jgi:hypothetical protein